MRLDLTAVVTGGARGIGRGIVVEAARRGYDVVFTHRGRGSDASETVAAASSQGTRVAGVVADLTTAEGIQAVVEVATQFSPLHLLINNAGMLIDGTIADTPSEIWLQHLQLHAWAPMQLARELAPAIAETNGAILNVASDGGVVGSVHGPAYGASKAATIGLGKTLARELAPSVRVNNIAPGPVATDMWAAVPDADRQLVEAQTPLKRVGSIDEVAAACLDICGWTYVTGQTIILDGGRVMW